MSYSRKWLIGMCVASLPFVLVACDRRQQPATVVITVNTVSSDGRYRVQLCEVPADSASPDRNFRLVLESLADATVQPTEIFRSPDEGAPPGTERIIWSADNNYFLLVGKRFYVDPEYRIPAGEVIYFAYHLPSGRRWCNASQRVDLARVSPEELERMTDWPEPISQEQNRRVQRSNPR
jgi:hypothetical protein